MAKKQWENQKVDQNKMASGPINPEKKEEKKAEEKKDEPGANRIVVVNFKATWVFHSVFYHGEYKFAVDDPILNHGAGHYEVVRYEK